jgi:hypothetical protein
MIPALIILVVLIIAYCILVSMLKAASDADNRAFVPPNNGKFTIEEYEQMMEQRDFEVAQKTLEDQFHRGSVPHTDIQQYGLDATQETERAAIKEKFPRDMRNGMPYVGELDTSGESYVYEMTQPEVEFMETVKQMDRDATQEIEPVNKA